MNEIPRIPDIPFDTNAVDWTSIMGIGALIIFMMMVGFILLRLMNQKHEREKLKMELEAGKSSPDLRIIPENTPQFKRMQDRLENLELLLFRLDTEMNQQLERSL